MEKRAVSVFAIIAILSTVSMAITARFQGLGDLPGGDFLSCATDISADGSVVVGVSGDRAFRWTVDTGMVVLGILSGEYSYSSPTDVSADGSVVVGFCAGSGDQGDQAFRWTDGTAMVGLGDLPGGDFQSFARAVSADGFVVVGHSDSGSTGGEEAFHWTDATGMVGLGYLPGGDYSLARAISADGSVVVGYSWSTSGQQAFRWTVGGGMVGLDDLLGGIFYSDAHAVSADGTTVAGYSESESGLEAFRWTAGTAMDGLGYLPGGDYSIATLVFGDGAGVAGWSKSASGDQAFRWTINYGMSGLGDLPGGDFQSSALAMSADGYVIVGSSETGLGSEAFYWRVSRGIVNLKEMLEQEYGLDMTGWTLTRAIAISDDGLTVVGDGINPNGDEEAWIVRFLPGEGTHEYVFRPFYCSVVQTGGVAGIEETYGIEGRLELTVDFDANTASFDMVDANLLDPSPYLGGYGTDLGELFDMTELVGTVISSTEIEFDTNDPMPGGKVVHLDLTISGIYAPTLEIYLTGGFCESWPDGFCFEMNARAVKKRVFYVDANAAGADDGSSWENAFDKLYEAIREARGCYGCEIWVARGTYKPDDYTCRTYSGEPQSQTFRLIDGVMIYGGFDGTETTRSERDWINNETILSGDLDSDGLDAENAWHVVNASGEDVGPTGGIDGFTVTGGYADGQWPENNGAGIYIHGHDKSPTIANCRIIDNYADISGAGMFIRYGVSNVSNCAFIGNSSGDGGGVACWSANLTLTNSLFSGNSAISDGGAIACADGNSTVTNCTFAQNTADFKGGGIFCGVGSDVRVYNSILWDNTADFGNQFYNSGGIFVADSSVLPGYLGSGCINEDPLFVDANGPDTITGTEDDNLRLKADSPCIDVGDANYPDPNYPTDLDGRDRTVDGDCNDTDIVDMGAFEFTSAYYSDFDGDCDVEFIDYSILADFWMTDEFSVDFAPTPAGNGIIDANDLAILCENWLYGK